METNKLRDYAKLTAQLNVLKAKQEVLKLSIISEMEKGGITSEDTKYGKFTYSTRRSYTYSEAVKKLMERVKVAKVKEEAKGIAKVKETNYLTFTNKKD